MRTQQELTALGEVLKTYHTETQKSGHALRFACLIIGVGLLLISFVLSLPILALCSLLPLAYGFWLLYQAKQVQEGLSIAIHQKGINPIHAPYNKAWLYEDIEYNYLFHTGVVKPDEPYNNLALRRDDKSPWFVIPAEMPEFTDFLQMYLRLHFEHRFPKLLKKIMQGHTVTFHYVHSDAALVRSLVDKTYDTPTKTIGLNQHHIIIDGESFALADLTLTLIDKAKNYATLTDQNQRLIFGNDETGVFNHILFIDLLTHLMCSQEPIK